MQQIMIIGNIGSDAVVQNFNGARFVSFRVAVSEKYQQNGQTIENTSWYSISYNRPDTKLLPFLKAGVKVFVQGKPRITMYDSAKYHQKMIDLGIMANIIELAGGGQQAQAPNPESTQAQPETEADGKTPVRAF